MRHCRDFVLLLLAMLAVATACQVAVHCLPRSWLAGNVTRSAEVLLAEGVYPHAPGTTGEFSRIDNYSDLLMLNMLSTADDRHPVSAAMRNTLTYNTSLPHGTDLAVHDRAHDPAEGETLFADYGRYWNGHQVLLRPLLCVTTWPVLRVVNVVLLSLLLLWLTAALWRRAGRATAVVTAAVLLWVAVPAVPLCFFYAHVFYIALTASLVVLYRPRWVSTRHRAALLFFAIGGVTAFVDLLSAPVVTLALPVVTLLSARRDTHAARTVGALSLAWLGGYALLWASKWLLCYLLTGVSVMDKVAENARLRTLGLDANGEPMAWHMLKSMRYRRLPALMGAMTACAALWLWRRRSSGEVKRQVWLLVVAAMTPVWVAVMSQHTLWHIRFAWRCVLPLVLGLALFVCHTVRWTRRRHAASPRDAANP